MKPAKEENKIVVFQVQEIIDGSETECFPLQY